MSGVIADLMVNLIANDTQLVTATRAAGEAMENLAKQGVAMSVNMKYAMTETGMQAQGMSVKIQESAEGSTRAMSTMAATTQRQLQALNMTMAELAGNSSRSSAEQIAAMSRQAEAAKALAKQQESEMLAAARETAQQRIAYEKEAADQARLAAQERLAIERSVVAQMNQDARDRVVVERMVGEEVAAMNKMFAEQTIATIKAVATASKETAAQQIASQKVVNDANMQSTKILKTLFGMFGDIGKAGIDFGKTFQGVATSVLGAGSAAVGVAGPIGMAVGAAGGMIKSAFDAATATVGMFLDVLKRVGEGLLAIGTVTVIAAAKFDQLMLRTVTLAQAPIQELGRMKQAVLDLSTEVGHTPDEMAKALYHVESLGYRGAEALDVLKRASQEAALSGSDLSQTTSALGAIMRAGLIDVKNTTDAASYLNTITGIGNMTMQDMVAGIGTGILPVLKANSMGMRDMGAALSVATDNAESSTQAMTRFRQVLAMISTMALQPKKVKMLESLGLEPRQLEEDLKKGTDQMSGFQVMLHDLHDHLVSTFGPQAIDQIRTYNEILGTDGKQAADEWATSNSKAIESIDALWGGARGSGGIDMYLTQLPLVDQKTQALGTSQERAARFAQSWKEQTQQLSQEWNNFKATIEGFAIKIGEKLIPFVKDLFHTFGEFGKSVGFIFSDSQIGDQFIDKIKTLAGQFIPWLKKELDDLAKWIKNNKDEFERLGRFITNDVLPAMDTLVKEGIHGIIEAIKWTIVFITGLTDAWQEHHAAIRVMLKLMAAAFLAVFQMILAAAIIAFGWIPGIGDKLLTAQAEFLKFAKEVNKAIDQITRVVPVEIYGFVSGPAGQLIGTGDNTFNTVRGSGGLERGRASGGPVDAGVPYLVGEEGPELVVFNQNGYVIPNNRMGSALGTGQRSGSPRPAGASEGGGGTTLVEARVYLDGRELYDSVIELSQRHKRRNTGTGVT